MNHINNKGMKNILVEANKLSKDKEYLELKDK